MTGEGHPRLDVVVDASTVPAAYFPDESTVQAQRLMEDYTLGRANLWAPRLVVLELINACLTAGNRNRIDDRLLDVLAAQLTALDIRWVEVEENARQVFSLSKEHGLTAYDAAYIVAAQMKGCKLITGDRRLYTKPSRGVFPLWPCWKIIRGEPHGSAEQRTPVRSVGVALG